ncbi:MAG: hypothetical protein B7Y56_13980 [Gallionellales bacterium 35-53-114]|nr:MAG: hypothetical protein B7Y56_13980 [Gallionellales bacterium 35-53-114]OYZ62965.1 MAG: hypothetical protein B7Y04_10835 [Gallionellales bacterium 24-53-125]OZB09053.1 MAG: hypothetical protein B7X61_08765 [Gallionellales bacterium 39-52-133]
MRCNNCKYLIILNILTVITFGTCAQALAADIPKRKSGLWEIKMQIDGAKNTGAILQCIDQDNDTLLQQLEAKAKASCRVMEIKYLGKKVTVHSVCRFGATTITTDAEFRGSFDTAYKGEIKTSYTPQIRGKSRTRVSMDAKWISPCLPGQKPGDVILPNNKSFNTNEMLQQQ